MKCNYRRRLAQYQVGALPGAEEARVREHLSSCAACRQELASLQATADLLRPMRLKDAPPQTWAAIRGQLRPRRSAVASRVRQWAPVFASIMLLLIVASVMLPMTHTATLSQPLADHDGYSQVQVAAAWDSPLADKASLGLAMIALDDEPGATESWN